MPWLSLFTALLFTLVLALIALRLFPLFGLMDQPEKYGHDREPIPYFGGLVIFMSMLVLTPIFVPLTKEVLALLTGSTLLVIVSFLDDRHGLPALLRLSVQAVAALILVAGGIGITHISNPFGGVLDLTSIDWTIMLGGAEYHFDLLADGLALIWIVTLINAINWMDGIPGLSSGVSGLSALVILVLAIRPDFHYFDQSTVITLAAIIAGTAIAFTFFNASPPKILLGDTGSMLLGFVIAALAIFSGAKIATAALVLGVPLIDALLVIGTRLIQRRAPWRGGEWDYDRTPMHLHHRLLAAGYSERQVLGIILFVSAVFGAVALFVSGAATKLAIFSIIALGMLTVVLNLKQQRK